MSNRYGSQPKPAAFKLLAGNPGNRPIGVEPSFTGGSPTPPDCLDADALKEWERIVPELDRLGLVKQADLAALATYCQDWADLQKIILAIRAEGWTIETPNGFPVKNPKVTIRNEISARLLKAAAQFGLTPVARARLASPQQNHNADDEELLN